MSPARVGSRCLEIALVAMACVSACAQVSVHRDPGGRVVYRRAAGDRAFKPAGIGMPPKGADPTIWYVYDPYIMAASLEEGVDPVLAKAMLWVESRGHWRATSTKDAKGLMQLMRRTAERFGHSGDLYEPTGNIRGGVRYLAYLQTRYSGNLIKVVAAYNAGEGAVDKHNGVPPFRETRDYVPKVLWTWDWIQRS